GQTAQVVEGNSLTTPVANLLEDRERLFIVGGGLLLTSQRVGQQAQVVESRAFSTPVADLASDGNLLRQEGDPQSPMSTNIGIIDQVGGRCEGPLWVSSHTCRREQGSRNERFIFTQCHEVTPIPGDIGLQRRDERAGGGLLLTVVLLLPQLG